MADAEGLTEYRHDDLDQLVEARYPDGTWERFTYDPVGNRTRLDSSEGLTEYAFDAADRLLSASGTSSVSYAWAPDGNLISKTTVDGGTQYSWSASGRLLGIEAPGGHSRAYGYLPGSDLRYRAVDEAGGEQRYLWDRGNVVQRMDGNNATVADYIEGTKPDEHLAQVVGGSLFAYLSEPSRTVRGLLDGAGGLVNSYL